MSKRPLISHCTSAPAGSTDRNMQTPQNTANCQVLSRSSQPFISSYLPDNGRKLPTFCRIKILAVVMGGRQRAPSNPLTTPPPHPIGAETRVETWFRQESKIRRTRRRSALDGFWLGPTI